VTEIEICEPKLIDLSRSSFFKINTWHDGIGVTEFQGRKQITIPPFPFAPLNNYLRCTQATLDTIE
jgi:hypothetical protein